VLKQPKNTKNAFLPVFELMSDSLMTIEVEPHQCPSHQSILHIQGPISEIFTKNIENWQSPENVFCLVFWLLGCSKILFFVFSQ
jgi:hypothetical protein